MNFFIADEHYNHSNILAFRTDSGRSQRPFTTVSEMHRRLIRNHNEVVSKTDTVYHLGDFAFYKSWKEVASILHQLNGNHVLILGNHDMLRAWDYVEAGFSSVHTSLDLGPYVLVHDPAVAGVVTERAYVHGHVHNMGTQIADNTYNVSVEMHDYYPVREDAITFKRHDCYE